MVGQEHPGVARGGGVQENLGDTPSEGVLVGAIPEDPPPLDPSNDDAMERSRHVDARLAWHGQHISTTRNLRQSFVY